MRTLVFHTLLYMALLLATVPAQAQKTCVIADAETHVPLRDALVHTDNGVWARTDYRGYFTVKYPFDSAEVSKKGYVKTRVYFESLPDSVFLLPEAEQLSTVEVWGTATEQVNAMENQIKEEVAEQPRAVTGIGFDLNGLFDRRARRDRKHLKKAKELGKEMDEQADPIIDAYEQATGRKYEEGEEPSPGQPSGDDAPATAPPPAPEERGSTSVEAETSSDPSPADAPVTERQVEETPLAPQDGTLKVATKQPEDHPAPPQAGGIEEK